MASERSVSSPRGSLGQAIHAVGEALSGSSVRGMLIGGIAVIARGVPRTTRDVDATIDGTALDLPKLLDELAGYGILPRIDDATVFARENQVLLLRHAQSGVDVDISIAWLPFELDAIAASEQLTIGGVRVAVARPEDLVIYKAVAWRPQDQQDIERLLTIYGASMDLARVRRIVAEFASALDEPERLAEFERLLDRVVR